MPSPSDGEEKVVRRRRAPARVVVDGDETPAVKRPRKTAVRKTPVKRAPRKVAPREADEEKEERVDYEHESLSRKAPTPIRGEQRTRQQRKRQIIVVGSILVVGIAISAAVGFTDSGQINVNQTIEARNERVRTNTTDDRDANTSLVEVPVQSTNDAGKSAGGFVGLGSVKTESPKKEEKTSSTTESTASSTASSSESVVAESTPGLTDNSETEEAPATE